MRAAEYLEDDMDWLLESRDMRLRPSCYNDDDWDEDDDDWDENDSDWDEDDDDWDEDDDDWDEDDEDWDESDDDWDEDDDDIYNLRKSVDIEWV